MIRRSILALSVLALAGCEAPPLGDDAAVAMALGAIQPALEAQNALLLEVDACTGCDTLAKLAAHVDDRLGSCATVDTLERAESPCGRLNGARVARVILDRCEVGVGKLVSGGLLLAQADRSVIRHFQSDLAAGDHGVMACGQVSGGAGSHSVAFDALAQGASGGEVLVAWTGPASVDRDGDSRRSGLVQAQFTGADGLLYEVNAEASLLDRRSGDSLPWSGSIRFDGSEGPALIEFGEETPRTGGLRLTRSNGSRETVVIAR